jgi:hypothetical protein
VRGESETLLARQHRIAGMAGYRAPRLLDRCEESAQDHGIGRVQRASKVTRYWGRGCALPVGAGAARINRRLNERHIP